MNQTDMPMDYHVWGTVLKYYQRYVYRHKADQRYKAERLIC